MINRRVAILRNLFVPPMDRKKFVKVTSWDVFRTECIHNLSVARLKRPGHRGLSCLYKTVEIQLSRGWYEWLLATCRCPDDLVLTNHQPSNSSEVLATLAGLPIRVIPDQECDHPCGKGCVVKRLMRAA